MADLIEAISEDDFEEAKKAIDKGEKLQNILRTWGTSLNRLKEQSIFIKIINYLCKKNKKEEIKASIYYLYELDAIVAFYVAINCIKEDIPQTIHSIISKEIDKSVEKIKSIKQETESKVSKLETFLSDLNKGEISNVFAKGVIKHTEFGKMEHKKSELLNFLKAQNIPLNILPKGLIE